MIHMITGGSASGKSAYAESCAVTYGKRRIYLATMQVWGEEERERIRRHRMLRRGKGFETVECPLELASLKLSVPFSGSCVLLECLSNLVANEQFEKGGTDEEILRRVFLGIENLKNQAEHLMIVTNEVFSDGCTYERETMRYLYLLGQANRWLARMADRVSEVVVGIAVTKKGEKIHE